MFSIVLGTASIGVLYGILNLILIPFLSAHSTSSLQPGQLISIGMMSTIFLGPLFGILSDRIRKRTPFVFGITIVAFLSIMGMTLPGNVLPSISAVLMVACAYSFLTPYSALVSDYSNSDTRDRNFGFIMGGVNISCFITSILISFIYDSSPRLTFYLLGLIVIGAFLPVAVFTRKHPAKFATADKKIKEGTFEFIKKQPKILIYLLAQFGIWFALGGLLPYLTSFFSSATSMTIGTASALVGASTLFSGIIALTTGFFSKKLGQKNLFIFSLSVITLVFAFMSIFYQNVIDSRSTFLYGSLFFIVFSISIGFLYSLNTSILSSMVSATDQGRAFGIFNVIMILSQSIALSVIGNLINRGGYRFMFIMVFAGFFVALGSVLYLFRSIKYSRGDINAKSNGIQ